MDDMRQQIFKIEKFSLWDKTTICLYFLISNVLVYFTLIDNIWPELNYRILFMYAFFTQIFIYYINYKSLRKLNVLIIWLFFGLGHLWIYFQLKASNLNLLNPDMINLFRNTIPLLILIQILRILSLNIQKQEFVAFLYGKVNLFDERDANLLDFVFLIIYFASMAFLLIV